MAERLQGLSLQEGGAAPCSPPLAQLEDLFAFSCAELGAGELETFRSHLQQIPSGESGLPPGGG